MAIRQPGMFLSQPGMVIRPSYHCAPMTVSIESAIRSRDCNEYDMPSVPMEMPSDTPIAVPRDAIKTYAAQEHSGMAQCRDGKLPRLRTRYQRHRRTPPPPEARSVLSDRRG